MNAPANITRKNLVTFYSQFLQAAPPAFPDSPPMQPPNTPPVVNPTSAHVVLSFKGVNGQSQQVTVPMALDSISNTWSASWDSSACIGGEYDNSPDGKVEWVVYGSGAAQAAQQGYFWVMANDANTI